MVALSDLTLREKILQTMVIRGNKDCFVHENVGGIFFGGEIITEPNDMGIDCARKILERYIENAKIPILITSDFENGCGSMFQGLTPMPYLMGLGAANSEELAYNYGLATALEARSIGANWTLSPVSDLNLNPRNPLVGIRSIGDDPDHAVRLLRQVVRGMQENGLAACAKHFPGDGLDYRDQHIVTTNNTLPFEQWKEKSGRIFQELIDAGVYSIMAGHITLPDYQKEVFGNGMKLPATLSFELITNLLKEEMGFDGVVVTDALGMGGFLGWYPTRRRSEVEAFKAGCDMMLWPTANYLGDMTEAIECGYIPVERLDDAVSRILRMKEKLGLFDKDNHATVLSGQDQAFIRKTQQETAKRSVTLIRDKAGIFPVTLMRYKKIAIIPISHYKPAYEESELLCEEIRSRGFEVDIYKDGLPISQESNLETMIDQYDLVIYALFSRSFRPIGFIDYMGNEAEKIAHSLNYAVEKTIVVSFGSPYFGEQYFERALTYVNAYSMLSPSVESFVQAAVGEESFGTFSPVHLK